MFSKYSIQKIISLFKTRFWKQLRECVQDTENVFNGIVVNKLKTVDSTDFPKLFYLLNYGAYFYHKKILTF